MATAATKDKEPVEKKVKTFDLTNQVLGLLGTPPDLFKVESKHLFGNWYRINVRIRSQINELVNVTTIGHSYFVQTNDRGDIVKGDEITKVYND
jgi:hypothetical protein